MWRRGAPQRRGARAAPKGRRCTYELLYEVPVPFYIRLPKLLFESVRGPTSARDRRHVNALALTKQHAMSTVSEKMRSSTAMSLYRTAGDLHPICKCQSRAQLKKSRITLEPFLRWNGRSTCITILKTIHLPPFYPVPIAFRITCRAYVTWPRG